MSEWILADGFRFGGIASGLRSEVGRRDLAVIVSERPAVAVGVFTQNRICAAPVHVCRERLPRTDARAVIICSGNANAATGEQGLRDARQMTSLTATALGCAPEQVLVASTGVIGRLLPMHVFESGIPQVVTAATPTHAGLNDAAHAIMTTDTHIKVRTRTLELNGQTIRLTGFAKGAAMIGPNMATMLGFLMTDAAVQADDLQTILRAAVEPSFNCISVEGHTSTNDTVLMLANGTGDPLHGESLHRFRVAVTEVCAELAKAIAADAEGADHFVTIEVDGCLDDAEAKKIAKTVAESALVKTAIHGADPNWGRIVSAAGYAGVPFEETELSLWMGDLPLYRDGQPLPFDAATASAYLKQNRDVKFHLRFSRGSGRCTFYTCDLTAEYVRLNADYTT
ncbi:bifunctional glutamate N-acetyltransferase/amino-acid acetyltransferase ArgJ [Tuwongella immobilis]|uniref:Arginine biosynthesis bifunctional protein ArgJ n=1 Tax=Tuwongella immobilis TaxID=692036 RepID=A0A6C2YS15_9BACT|nr:bifunctional glutamate N-acetyltransferase/amino-acid acetyltransferase ArgJ [Tuwongella immobilis]VIP04151.1 arginine biosynthesis bifunctional protein : Arginine biosynthesis bifunctional protein ArgJ OS=Planctomyces limnophilus (strain ATCC 43296 / DSM 3776 / IFAM 1008 / 290) GN=argJ PE=3 SV=1: ArgJ [Tuwongella immobilis]VTS05667.1 arginine biosynthesis bifunctional protein : Arginine biosynthesis bifunctional protein ArgJ OS=Planctomyces limnophilus (strain ATCC 43296 / DSM 3776 / IFAM 100